MGGGVGDVVVVVVEWIATDVVVVGGVLTRVVRR